MFQRPTAARLMKAEGSLFEQPCSSGWKRDGGCGRLSAQSFDTNLVIRWKRGRAPVGGFSPSPPWKRVDFIPRGERLAQVLLVFDFRLCDGEILPPVCTLKTFSLSVQNCFLQNLWYEDKVFQKKWRLFKTNMNLSKDVKLQVSYLWAPALKH